MSEKDAGNLLGILEACHKIKEFVKDTSDADAFYADQKTFDAVLMNFVVIGESVGRLSYELKQSADHIPWAQIKGFRNIIAHDYFGVDAEEVWQLIQSNIPELEHRITKLLRS